MRAKTRSISGAALMLLIIPGIVGLLACMPVPIGDPERSRVDPELNGVWYLADDSDPGFYAFEPYDKRTWLLTGMPLEEGPDADFSDYDLDTHAGFAALAEAESIGDDGAVTSKVVLYKAWRKKLASTWFMTWEPKAQFEEEDFAPDMWIVFRIERPDADTLHLYMVNGEDDVFEEVDKTRRAYERALKKNARNDEIYAEDPIRLTRLTSDEFEFFSLLADEAIAD